MQFGGKTVNITCGRHHREVHQQVHQAGCEDDVRAHATSCCAVHHRGSLPQLPRRETQSGRAQLQDQWTQHCGDVLHGGRTAHPRHSGD